MRNFLKRIFRVDKENNKKTQKKHPVLKKILLGAGVFFFLSFLGIGAFIWSAVAGTPQWDPDKLNNPKYDSIIYDSEGNEIAQLSAQESRLAFQYEDLPELLVETIIAVEDNDFYEHVGVDIVRLVKRTINSIIHPNDPINSSTITIQLARNVFMEDSRSMGLSGLKRKIQEASLAIKIEKTYSKAEILTAYLSHIYLGHGSFGVRSAAKTYFDKDLDQLSVADIAMICGLPAAPSAYDPYVNAEKAKYRRTIVLGIMRDKGLITAEEFEQCKEEPFSYIETAKADITGTQFGFTSKYPYFVDYVVRCLLNDEYHLTPDQIYNGGLRIYTTVNPKVQQKAEDVLKDPDNFPPPASDGIFVQGALVMLDNRTGDVIAMVGGREYPQQTFFGFSRASDGKHQLGGVASPLIVYAPALEYGGYDAKTVIDDAPVSFGSFSPRNIDGKFRGPITMREAIKSSVNICAIKLYQEVGPEYCWNFAKKAGLELADSEYTNFANALGAFTATPLELAQAYAAFPNQGVRNEARCITKITDVNGTVLQEPSVQNRQVMQESTAAAMDDLLRSVVADGTGQEAAIDNWDICGKTGTTSSDAMPGGPDAWFVGYSPFYTAAVWIGYDVTDKDHYLSNGHANSVPVGLWKKTMLTALADKS